MYGPPIMAPVRSAVPIAMAKSASRKPCVKEGRAQRIACLHRLGRSGRGDPNENVARSRDHGEEHRHLTHRRADDEEPTDARAICIAPGLREGMARDGATDRREQQE